MSQHLDVEQLAAPLGPGEESHVAACAECRQLVAAAEDVGSIPVVVPTALTERVLATARAELAKKPRVRKWWKDAGLLIVASISMATMAGAMMGGTVPQEGSRLVLLAGLLGVQVLAGVSAIAPRRRVWRIASFALAALAAVVAIASAGGTPPATRGPGCAAMELGLAVLPLGLGLLLLQSSAPISSRFLSLGVATGAIGAFVLGIHCTPSPEHVALFHVVPWGVVSVAAVLAGRLLPRRSYAP